MGLDEEIIDEPMDDLEENGGGLEIQRDGYDDELLVKKDKDRSRESGKHRSTDRKKGRREEKEHGSKDKERSMEREINDRVESARERNKDDKDRDRDKERTRDKGKEKEKDYDRDKFREKDRELERGKDRGKERDRDKDMDREREWSLDRERERGRDRGRGRGREREKDKESERQRDSARDRDKDHEWDQDKGHERIKVRERDHDKERVKDKDRERGKDRDRVKDKTKDREKEDKEKDRERDKGKEKAREKEMDRIREREMSRGKEGEEDERAKVDGGDGRIVARRGEEAEAEGYHHERIVSKHHNDKALGSQSTSELQERVMKMKQERLKRKSDDVSDISSWVNKSRKLEENRNSEQEKVVRLSRILEEQDNIAEESDDDETAEHSRKDLAGVKILHGLDKVIEGGAVVLTLKDQSILADGDINEEVDMLENVEIGEQKQRDEAYMAAKKKTGIYEDKFSDDMISRKTILPQYDDPIEDEGITLDESGHFAGEAEKKLEELRKRIEGSSTKKGYEDLTSSGKSLSDYYTADEMLQFKKPKKKKSLRKREKLDLDALEAEAISAGLGAGDLGSRNDLKRQSAKEEEARTDAETRSNAYQSALAKAEEASKALREEQTLTVKGEDDENLVFGEDYEDLEKSLEQTRRLALKKQEDAAASGPQAVALLALANKDREEAQSSTPGDPQENRLVITEMEEFVLGLQFNEDAHKPEPEDVFKDEEDISESVDQEMIPEDGGWTEVNESNKDELAISEEKEDIAPDEIIREVAVGKGLAGALKLLKDRGTLKESIDWGGRNMDKKKSKLVGINDSDGQKEIRIERTDEFGRIMTPKEAFRMISHKFHGKGPGKMKQEKRMKQYQEDLKTKQMKGSDTPSQAMERMREAQAQLKTPYLVLSGHVKPGQTSDPRSGFATVEKDHLGSLTPMLGDKKVEHFLGINRKPDSGSMGPPPPKKLKS